MHMIEKPQRAVEEGTEGLRETEQFYVPAA